MKKKSQYSQRAAHTPGQEDTKSQSSARESPAFNAEIMSNSSGAHTAREGHSAAGQRGTGRPNIPDQLTSSQSNMQ